MEESEGGQNWGIFGSRQAVAEVVEETFFFSLFFYLVLSFYFSLSFSQLRLSIFPAFSTRFK